MICRGIGGAGQGLAFAIVERPGATAAAKRQGQVPMMNAQQKSPLGVLLSGKANRDKVIAVAQRSQYKVAAGGRMVCITIDADVEGLTRVGRYQYKIFILSEGGARTAIIGSRGILCDSRARQQNQRNHQSES